MKSSSRVAYLSFMIEIKVTLATAIIKIIISGVAITYKLLCIKLTGNLL
jgi:hypothetical protein